MQFQEPHLLLNGLGFQVVACDHAYVHVDVEVCSLGGPNMATSLPFGHGAGSHA
jgi:hypothetical protein